MCRSWRSRRISRTARPAACCPDRGRRARRGPAWRSHWQKADLGRFSGAVAAVDGEEHGDYCTRRAARAERGTGASPGRSAWPCARPGRPPSAATRPGQELRPGRRSPGSTTEISCRPETVTWKSIEPSWFRSTRCVLCQATSATFSATSGVKRTTTSWSGPRLGNHPPGVAQMAFDGKTARHAIRLVEHFQQEDAAEVEGPRGPVQRRAADHVPTSLAEEQAVGIEPRENDLLLGQTAVANAHAVMRRNRIDQLLIDGRAAVQRIAGRRVDHHGVGRGAQLLADAAAGRLFSSLTAALCAGPEKRQPVAQLMAEHDQRQGFLGGEVGGRQIIRARECNTAATGPRMSAARPTAASRSRSRKIVRRLTPQACASPSMLYPFPA